MASRRRGEHLARIALAYLPVLRHAEAMGFAVAGMGAMGALLVVSMGVKNVFLLAAAIAAFLTLYAWKLIARPARLGTPKPNAAAIHGFLPGLISAVRDLQFVKSMLLIGIPAKAMLTGVTIFALPLLLAASVGAPEE